MRIIDADVLYEKFKDGKTDTVQERGINSLGRYLIRNAPTVDAVPVVRCKECKLYGNCTFEETFITAGLAESRRYCGAGEKRGDNDV